MYTVSEKTIVRYYGGKFEMNRDYIIDSLDDLGEVKNSVRNYKAFEEELDKKGVVILQYEEFDEIKTDDPWYTTGIERWTTVIIEKWQPDRCDIEEILEVIDDH